MSIVSKFWRRFAPAKTVRWLEGAEVLYTRLELHAFDSPLELEAELEFLAEAQWAYNAAEHVLAFAPAPAPSADSTLSYLLAIAPRSAVAQALRSDKKVATQVFWQAPTELDSMQRDEQSDFGIMPLRFYPDYRAERKAANQRFYLELMGVCALVYIAAYGWGLRLESDSRGLETQLAQLQASKHSLLGTVQHKAQRLQTEQTHLRLLSELDAKITTLTQPLNTPALSLDAIHYDGAGFQVQGSAQGLQALARASKALPGASLEAQALTKRRTEQNETEDGLNGGVNNAEYLTSTDTTPPVPVTESTRVDHGLKFVLKWRP